MPVLLLSVVSRDSWGRCVPQGYAAVPLPTVAGSHTLDVPTWKPEGSVREKLGNFFLGGAAFVRDADYPWVPSVVNPRSQVRHAGSRRVSRCGVDVACTLRVLPWCFVLYRAVSCFVVVVVLLLVVAAAAAAAVVVVVVVVV